MDDIITALYHAASSEEPDTMDGPSLCDYYRRRNETEHTRRALVGAVGDDVDVEEYVARVAEAQRADAYEAALGSLDLCARTRQELRRSLLARGYVPAAVEATLDRLAEACYVSKSHLGHQFKTYTGLTLYQFIIKKRVTVARNMIREGAPVMDACMKCGFNDYSNFLKAFKREFGRSPKEFSKRA